MTERVESRSLPENGGTSDQQQGLYRKYNVERLNDPTGKHADCTYYVLDLVHDRHAAPALLAYAASCEAEFPDLAKDLRAMAAEIPNASTVSETGTIHHDDWYELVNDRERYVATFQHFHINKGDGSDACGQCGLDLRDKIHRRNL